MAGNIKLNSASGGSITLAAYETSTDKTLTLPAMNGVALVADFVTGAAPIPSGTTAQRPASPTVGMLRLNTTIGALEYYDGTNWSGSTSPTATYVIVSGGGAGAADQGGGGGGGGYYTGTIQLTKGATYTFVVGGGNGGVSSAFGLSPTGGNGGGSPYGPGGSSGSGTNPVYTGGGGSDQNGGGGGGGVAGNGVTASGKGGNGGPGATLLGHSFGGGGGGGAYGWNGAGTGTFGGGNGGANANGNAGTANSGGGGGGGGWNGTIYSGASGGSGTVIISVPLSQFSGVYTGTASATFSNGNAILKFNSSGTYTA